MTEKIQIIPAKKTDFENIYSLLQQLFNTWEVSRQSVKSFFQKNLKSPRYLIFIAKKEKETIGFGTIAIIDNVRTCSKIAILDALVIDEKQRNKGYGKKLLPSVMEIAKKKKCTELHFSSTFKRKDAHKFYEKIGFHKTAYYFYKEL